MTRGISALIVMAIARSLVIAETDGVKSVKDTPQHYQILQLADVKYHRMKRTASAQVKHLTFDALDRSFKLKLWTNAAILTRDFRLVSVDSTETEKEVHLDTSHFYHGQLEDDASSQVFAYEEEEGTLTASIHTKEEIYTIEPAWRHIPSANRTSMIVYRDSDVDPPSDFRTSSVEHEEDSHIHLVQKWQDNQQNRGVEEGNRVKRQSDIRKTSCPMMLVADYLFFERIGQHSYYKTASYMIGLLDRVDNIFRDTDFGSGYHGMGFQVREIRIHEVPTVVPGDRGFHYNEETDQNPPMLQLLESFSKDARHRSFCLSRLFTGRTWESGILGISYVASPVLNDTGGICSSEYYKGGYQLYFGTGVNTALNRRYMPLLTQQMDLAVAHGLGHNWGSEHDPDGSECSPESAQGGKYIMYKYPLAGQETNNKLFSPCSRRSIQKVLTAKSHLCFKEASGAVCGNGVVESVQCPSDGTDCDHSDDEECDTGPHVLDGADQCCDEHCKLKLNAQCSSHDECCGDSCQYAHSVKCHQAMPNACDSDSYCTGMEKTCPVPPHKPDGVSCSVSGTSGQCLNGICMQTCEITGHISCTCEDAAHSCLVCCQTDNNSPCQLYRDAHTNATIPLADNVFCGDDYGMCSQGVCESMETSDEWDVQRLWELKSDTTVQDSTTAKDDTGSGGAQSLLAGFEVVVLALVLTTNEFYY